VSAAFEKLQASVAQASPIAAAAAPVARQGAVAHPVLDYRWFCALFFFVSLRICSACF
jgi:hypothetical protein